MVSTSLLMHDKYIKVGNDKFITHLEQSVQLFDQSEANQSSELDPSKESSFFGSRIPKS